MAENSLGQQFKVSHPNAIWVSDITYIPNEEGWLYLAGHKDLFTGEIVGYAMGERLTRSLVSQSLFRAVAAKHPARGLIHHAVTKSLNINTSTLPLLKCGRAGGNMLLKQNTDKRHGSP